MSFSFIAGVKIDVSNFVQILHGCFFKKNSPFWSFYSWKKN